MVSRARKLMLIVVGALLCTAIAATAAFGSVIKTESSPTYFSAQSAVSFKFGGTAPGPKAQLDCPTMKLAGSTASGKSFEKVRLHPSFSGCKWASQPYLTSSVEVPESCDLELAMPAGMSSIASLNFVGCTIKIVGPYGCFVEIGSQTGLSGVTLTNVGTGKNRVIDALFAVTGMKVKGNTSACGGVVTTTVGEMSASTTLAGYSDSLLTKQSGIWFE